MQLTSSPSKESFHGSLARKFAHRKAHEGQPTFDISVAYTKRSAIFRGLTPRGQRYLTHFIPDGKTDHVFAALLVSSLKANDYRVKVSGSPALPHYMEIVEEVAA